MAFTEDEKRTLVAGFSRGSVGLRTGNYITKEEKDKLREKILNHNFLKGIRNETNNSRK